MSRRLLLISPSLGHGGMELQLLDLARASGRRNRRATVLAGDGPLADAAASVADVELIDWDRPRVDTARAARALQGEGGVAVLQADPALIHLVPSLAVQGLVHLCLHNRPGSFEHWFNPGLLERFRRLVPALHAAGRVTFTASSRAYALEHSAQMGLPPGAVSAWFPGVDAPEPAPEPSTDRVRRIAVVCRLSTEKLPIIAAGAELVAAGIAAGARVELHLHGGGPAEPDVRELLAARLPQRAYRLLGPTGDPFGAAAAADAVVNAGRAAIEALVMARPVVTPRIRGGGLGPLVRPSNFGELKDGNFVWREEPHDAAAIWRQLEALSSQEVRLVRDRARRELSTDAVLEDHLAAMARTDAARPPTGALLAALVEHALALEDAHAGAQRLADELWAARS